MANSASMDKLAMLLDLGGDALSPEFARQLLDDMQGDVEAALQIVLAQADERSSSAAEPRRRWTDVTASRDSEDEDGYDSDREDFDHVQPSPPSSPPRASSPRPSLFQRILHLLFSLPLSVIRFILGPYIALPSPATAFLTAPSVSFSSALSRARAQGKLLLVYLHAPYHEDTQRFVTLLFGSDPTRQYLEDTGACPYLLWLCEADSAAAMPAARFLSPTGLPFLAVLSSLESATHPALLYHHIGLMSPPSLRDVLERIASTQRLALLRAKSQRAEQDLTRSLRAQQDAAYQRSLEADRRKRQERLAQEARETEARAAAEAQRAQAQSTVAACIAAWQGLAAELDAGLAGSTATKACASDASPHFSLSVRLPGGSRLPLKMPGSASLAQLHGAVYEALYPGNLPDAPRLVQLSTNFPKRALVCEAHTSLAAAQIASGFLLYADWAADSDDLATASSM